jgi:hypothetical protein
VISTTLHGYVFVIFTALFIIYFVLLSHDEKSFLYLPISNRCLIYWQVKGDWSE